MCAVSVCVFAASDGTEIFDIGRAELIILMGYGAVSFCSFAAVTYLLDRIMKTVKGGDSPFTEDNARTLKLMAFISVVCAAAVLAEQAVGIAALSPSDYSVSLPTGQVGGAIVLYVLALIFGYGAQLQKESDETL